MKVASITKKVRLLTRKVRLLTRKVPLLTRKVRLLTRKVRLLARKVRLLTRKVWLPIAKVRVLSGKIDLTIGNVPELRPKRPPEKLELFQTASFLVYVLTASDPMPMLRQLLLQPEQPPFVPEWISSIPGSLQLSHGHPACHK